MKIYFKMFLSYAVMLLIPIIVGGVIYGYSFRTTRSQAQKLNDNLLEMTQRDIDQKLLDVQKLAARLALDTGVQSASKIKGNFQAEDKLSLYYLNKELQAIPIYDEFISDIFIYFNRTQSVCSISGNMSGAMFYDLYYSDSQLSFEEFQKYMGEAHFYDVLKLDWSNEKNTLLFTMTTLDTAIGEKSATIGIGVDYSKLEQRLDTMKWDDQMEVMIIGENHEQISSGFLGDNTYEIDFEKLEPGSHLETSQFGKPYLISVLNSQARDWKYVAITPMSLIDRDAKSIRVIAVVSLFACVITGFWVSYYQTKKNYNPIQNLMHTFQKHGNVEMDDGENVYQWLSTQMERVFQKQLDTESLVQANRKTLKNYYLIRLLQNSYYGDGSELDSYGIRLAMDYNMVIIFEPEAAEEAGRDDMLQRFIVTNIFTELCQEYFNVEMVEIGKRVAAIANLPDDSDRYTEILREKVEALQAMTEESFKFSCTVLMGAICKGVEGIRTSYLQADDLEQYVVLLDTNVISYEEVKNIQIQYEYSVEMEQKILNAIEAGDSKQAGQYMMQVFDRNLSGAVSADIYRCLVYDMVGPLLRGARMGGYDEAASELEFPDGFTMKKLPVGELTQQFLGLLDLICGRILEMKKETDQDKTLSRKIEAFIQDNYQDPDLNISITSQHFNITPAYLSSLYKKQTGGSLLDYINSIRITHAQELLEQGLSVVEVAVMVGFRDSGSFIRAFKKKTGVTPGQFKKKF